MIAPGAILNWMVHEFGVAELIKPLAELQDAIKKRLDLRLVGVTMGKARTAVIGTGGTGSSTTSLLKVDAQLNYWNDDEFEALLPKIAGTVLDLRSDLLGNDQLVVKVTRSFDLGIANFSDIRREQLDATAWRANLTSLYFRPRPAVALCLYMFLCFAENNSE